MIEETAGQDYTLGLVEGKFADLIWANAPLSSGDLARLAEQALGWKRTTSYTVLRKLCDKGFFRNTKGQVTVLLSRERYYGRQGRQLVEQAFNGSLPLFLAAFTEGEKLSAEQVAALQALIEKNGEVRP